MTLEELLKEEKYRTMIDKYSKKIYSKFQLERYIELEDFLQEVYIQILRNIHKFDSNRASISTYLYLLAYQKSRNVIKLALGKDKIANLNAIYLDERIEVGGNVEITGRDLLVDAQDVEREALDNVLIEKLTELGDKYLKATIEGVLSGKSKLQISKGIGKSRAVVDKRLQIIREELNK